jgi:tetratricopeptide (TPR) repeat protein
VNIRINIAMAKYTTNDVLELAGAIRRAPEKVAFLTGAGCSLSAGIPLAKALVEEIRGKYPGEVERLVKPEQRRDYGACMGALAIDERKALLAPYLAKPKINWAHIALASLIRDGFVRRVLTFNFDSVLARACGLLGQYPATYDFGVSPSDQTDYLADSCVVHLHGQGFGRVMLNDGEETREHASKVRPLLDDTFAKFPLVVVGYSGEADKVFEQLCAAYTGRQRLFWLGFDEEPKEHLRPLLGGRHKNICRYFGGADADAILIALAQKLGCFPPQVFANPAGHLLEEIKDVAEFPLDKVGPYDLLEDTRERLNGNGAALRLDEVRQAALRGDFAAIKAMEEARIRPRSPLREFLGPLLKRLFGWNALLAGWKSLAPRVIAAWAHISSGNDHYEKAKAGNSAEEYELAAREYAKALVLKPDMHEALFNWGIALLGLARLKDDEVLFREACAKYEAALVLKPDDHEALNNWGSAFGDLAQLKGDEALFRDSFAKFEAALAIKPDYHEALNNWGLALTGLAQLKGDEALFRDSFAKFEAALAIKPDKHEALNNWGSALGDLAKLKGDEALFREAIGKYEAALAIKPDMHEALYNWGSALDDLARLKGDEALFREAFAKYEAALAIKPDKHKALYNWGIALLSLWQLTKDAALLDKARDVLDRAEWLNPRKPYNRACLAALLGDEEGCRERLMRAKEFGTLPPPEHLQTDPDLENMRDKPWFKELAGL